MITSEQLQQVTGWLSRNADDHDLQSLMRGEFPELHFTFCSDDDIALDEPACSSAQFNLYLVDGSNHCLALTSDLAAASGLVVAEREEDD